MRTGEGCVWDPDDEIEYLLRPNIPLGPVTFPITQTHFVRFTDSFCLRFTDSFCLRRYLHAAGVNYTLLWSKSEMEAIWETHADFEVAFRQEMGDLLQITHDRIKVFRTYRPCQHFLLLTPAAFRGEHLETATARCFFCSHQRLFFRGEHLGNGI